MATSSRSRARCRPSSSSTSTREPFRSADFAGHWSFLYFGYTYCPDVCPLTLVELASLEGQLAAERPAARIEYYLVSVDPQRDTPARLREYVAYFDPELPRSHGLAGRARRARASDRDVVRRAGGSGRR